MIHKWVTATALAYIAIDAVGFYKTIPEIILMTGASALGIVMLWTWIEAKAGDRHDAR